MVGFVRRNIRSLTLSYCDFVLCWRTFCCGSDTCGPPYFSLLSFNDLLYVYIIDQARGQDGWILAKFSFCVFMDQDEVEVHKNAKRELGQYPAILTELAWSIKDLLYGIKSTEKMIFVLVYFEH